MGKLFFNLLLLAGLYYLYDTGVLQALASGNVPQVGRKCEVCGPKGGYVYMALSKQYASYPIDAAIGFSSRDRANAESALARAVESDIILTPDHHTKVEVLANDKAQLWGCTYRISKVEILEGEYKGKKGWVQREDVIDTPIQDIIQKNFRSGGKRLTKEMIDNQGNDPDQWLKTPVHRRPRFQDYE